MVSTIADRLGIDFYRAAEMADAAHAAGLVRHEHGTVTLTGEGLARGATFKPPTAS
jgi:Mn-dependent DtxR family transcriptional regulator